MLEIPGYHEVGHPTDHHRDMRLDIDHMSYEVAYICLPYHLSLMYRYTLG